MVKGISRQVLVVQSPDRRLFEQAIFILNDHAPAVTEEELIKEAQKLMTVTKNEPKLWHYGAFWSGVGAAVTGLVWLLTIFLA